MNHAAAAAITTDEKMRRYTHASFVALLAVKRLIPENYAQQKSGDLLVFCDVVPALGISRSIPHQQRPLDGPVSDLSLSANPSFHSRGPKLLRLSAGPATVQRRITTADLFRESQQEQEGEPDQLKKKEEHGQLDLSSSAGHLPPVNEDLEGTSAEPETPTSMPSPMEHLSQKLDEEGRGSLEDAEGHSAQAPATLDTSDTQEDSPEGPEESRAALPEAEPLRIEDEEQTSAHLTAAERPEVDASSSCSVRNVICRSEGASSLPNFYGTFESLRNVEENGAREALFQLQQAQQGLPLYPRHIVKVIGFWRGQRAAAWDLSVSALEIEGGYNPTLRDLLQVILLNMSEQLMYRCKYSLSSFLSHVEIWLEKDPQAVYSVVREADLAVRMRDVREARLVVERTASIDTVLLLKPTVVYIQETGNPEGQVPLEGFPDIGPAVYNFQTAFAEGWMKSLILERDANESLQALSASLRRTAIRLTEKCALAPAKLSPAFTALIVESGAQLYHLPLTNMRLCLRDLNAAADIVKGTIKVEVRIRLVVYFPYLSNRDALELLKCVPDFWNRLKPRARKPRFAQSIKVLVNVTCKARLPCHRKSIIVYLADPTVTAADALITFRLSIAKGVTKNAFHDPAGSCFVGHARLKQKRRAMLGLREQWMDIPSQTPLLDLEKKSGLPLLLAPKEKPLLAARRGANTFCTNYLYVIKDAPFVVRPYTKALPDTAGDERAAPIFSSEYLPVMETMDSS